MVVNYYDCAADHNELTPYIFDFRHLQLDSFKQAMAFNYEKSALKKIANQKLNWNAYFKSAFKDRLT